MICHTIRKGKNCVFMGSKRCGFNNGQCYPVVEKCDGCTNTEEYNGQKYCVVYMDPGAIWATACGRTTVKKVVVSKEEKKINPLKASKKAAKAKKEARANAVAPTPTKKK